MSDLEKAFKEVKKQNWVDANVSFYVVKRKLVKKVAKYSLLEVNVDKELAKKLRSISVKVLNKANQAIDYDFNTSDQDGNFLSINTSETDLSGILEIFNNGEKLNTVSNQDDLISSWAYISKLEIDGIEPLYALRKISDTWSTKKVFSFANVIFADNVLMDLKNDQIFKIDSYIDFFAYEDKIFIANKKNFESVMNFREGMIKNRDEIVQEFKKQKVFSDPEKFGELVGDNLSHLRKLSSAKKAGYYKDTAFLQNLAKINKEKNWGIVYTASGEIDVEQNELEVLLTLLNNGRLTSEINHENFYVDVKRKI